MKISPLTEAETLEQICFFVRSATRDLLKGRSAVFISPLKTIKRKVKRKKRKLNADQVVVGSFWKMSPVPPNKLQQQREF